MRRARCRAGRHSERGAVIVEMAIMLPVFTIFLVTIADLGLVLREYQIVQNAAREGARYSVIPTSWIDTQNPGATEAAIKDRVVEYLNQEGITDVTVASVTLNQILPITVGGKTVTATEITVTYDRPLLIAGGLLPGPGLTLHATAVFRNLHP